MVAGLLWHARGVDPAGRGGIGGGGIRPAGDASWGQATGDGAQVTAGLRPDMP